MRKLINFYLVRTNEKSRDHHPHLVRIHQRRCTCEDAVAVQVEYQGGADGRPTQVGGLPRAQTP